MMLYADFREHAFLGTWVNKGQLPVEKYQLGRYAALVKYGSKWRVAERLVDRQQLSYSLSRFGGRTR